MTTIAFIGLGTMGLEMASNLVKAGHTVRGFDVVPAANEAATGRGITVCGSAAEALDGAEAAVTMLPRGEHVAGAYLGDDGILAHADTSTLLIDSSTIDVETCGRVHEAAKASGHRFVDAPVSGGQSGAAAGTLTFMAGGEADAVEAARPILDPMAGNVIATGGPTTGEAAKICNNMMLFICLEACAEGASLAKRLGLDPKTFWDIAHVSSGDSWALRTWYPVPGIVDSAGSSKGFDATFRADLAHKDVGLALQAAEQTGLDLPAATLAQQAFARLLDEGDGARDCSLIIRHIDDEATGAPKPGA